MKTTKSKLAGLALLTLSWLVATAGTARADVEIPRRLRFTESPITEVEITSVVPKGKRYVGNAVATLYGPSGTLYQTVLVVKAKHSKKGTWKIALKTFPKSTPAIRAVVVMSGGSSVRGKVVVRWDSIRARDKLGRGDVFVHRNAPPVASIRAEPASGTAPLLVSFDATASRDPDGSISKVEWDLGDGAGGSGSEVTHTYTEPGTYRVKLVVTDDEGATGEATETVRVDERPNEPPVPGFLITWPTGVSFPLHIHIDASGSHDPDGELVSARWDFDDGTEAMGLTVEHTYTEPGTYRVTLVLTDDDGATAELTSAGLIVSEPVPVKWTYMVYMDTDADSRESALLDLNEMERAGSSSNVNVVGQMDLPGASNGLADGSARFRIRRGVGSLEHPESTGLGDMSSPATLRNFIEWAIRTHPAERYALVIWKPAPRGDVRCDFSDLPGIAQAIRDTGVHFGVIDFDASMMATVEVAYELAGLCDFLVASQGVKPARGNPYNAILAYLRVDADMDQLELARTIVGCFHEFHLSEGRAATKSAVLTDLTVSLKSFLDAIAAYGRGVPHIPLGARGASMRFEDPASRDLAFFCLAILQIAHGPYLPPHEMDNLRGIAAQTAGLAQGSVVANGPGGGGLSIFLPNGIGEDELDDYAALAFNQDGDPWLRLVKALATVIRGDVAIGGFEFSISWDTDAEVSLCMEEPDGSLLYESSPNGTLSGHRTGPGSRRYAARDRVEPGRYTPGIRVEVDRSSGARTTVHMEYRARGDEDWSYMFSLSLNRACGLRSNSYLDMIASR